MLLDVDVCSSVIFSIGRFILSIYGKYIISLSLVKTVTTLVSESYSKYLSGLQSSLVLSFSHAFIHDSVRIESILPFTLNEYSPLLRLSILIIYSILVSLEETILLFSTDTVFNPFSYSIKSSCNASSPFNLVITVASSSFVNTLNLSFSLPSFIRFSLNGFSISITFNFDKSTNVPELPSLVTSTIKKFSYVPLPSTSIVTFLSLTVAVHSLNLLPVNSSLQSNVVSFDVNNFPCDAFAVFLAWTINAFFFESLNILSTLGNAIITSTASIAITASNSTNVNPFLLIFFSPYFLPKNSCTISLSLFNISLGVPYFIILPSFKNNTLSA